VVFLVTVIVGSVYSLPKYGRLVALLHTSDDQHPLLQRRIAIAAWVNRVELLLVVIGLVGMIVQPRF